MVAEIQPDEFNQTQRILEMSTNREYDHCDAQDRDHRLTTPEENTIDTESIVRIAAEAALDKKATDLTLLHVEGLTSFCDWFVLCNGSNSRQIQAIGQGIVDSLKAEGHKPLGVEGMTKSKWILIDLGDILVHVFDESMRGYYDLDGLWVDAPRVAPSKLGIEVDAEAAAAPSK